MKLILVAVFFFNWTWSAWAIEQSPAPPVTKMIFKKSESHQFSGAKLKGRFKKPEMSYIYKRKGTKEEPYINFPEDFNHEIINGAGQL